MTKLVHMTLPFVYDRSQRNKFDSNIHPGTHPFGVTSIKMIVMVTSDLSHFSLLNISEYSFAGSFVIERNENGMLTLFR